MESPTLKDKIREYMRKHVSSSGLAQNTPYCYRHRPDRIHFKDNAALASVDKELTSLPADEAELIRDQWEYFRDAPAHNRSLLLRGLLSMCCFPQLSEVNTIIKDLVRIDFLTVLPIELGFKILGYLDAKSLAKASQVSKKWKTLADDDVVWHHLCTQHIAKKCTTCGWGLPLLERKRLKRTKQAMEERLQTLRAQSPMVSPMLNPTVSECTPVAPLKRSHDAMELQDAEPSSSNIRPWRDVYIERYKVENNWRLGRQRMTEFVHPSSVLCLQFDDTYLITGTFNGDVTIWDIETAKKVRTLKGHIYAVSALKFDQNKLVTGSWDQSVRVWNYRTGKCLCTFKGHDSKALCVDFDGNLIACGNADATIKVWDFSDKSCYTLRGHSAPVHSVRIQAQTSGLYSASEDLTVRMWDLETKKCIKIFGGPDGTSGHVAQIQQALPIRLEHLEGEDHDIEVVAENDSEGGVPGSPNYLLTASLDNTIKLWHIKTGKCARTLFGHVEGVWCIAADDFRIVSGAHDKQVKIWDLQSGKCWHTFSGHTRPVCCVGLTDTKFASGGDDGVVKLYNFDI